MTNETSIPMYLDPARPIAERVQDLISRLTLSEKITQMNHPAQAIPRLGVPAYNYWSEALHGVARNGRATVFPQAIGLAATWDADLVRRIASAIGDVVPFHRLIAFRRVALAPGESRELTFAITPELLTLVDEDGGSRLEPGDFRLTVGGCSPGARGMALGAPEPVSAVFTLGE